MPWWFLAGFISGSALLFVLYFSTRRALVRLDEEKQLLEQEQKIVVNFMHEIVEATGQDIDRKGLFQRIAHAAVKGTNAISACVFELSEEDSLVGVAAEGLFPPLRALVDDGGSRAKLIDSVRKLETFQMGEGLIGGVGKSHKPMLIVDTTKEPRMVLHDDPALLITSLIIAPMRIRGELIGVLAVANPADGQAFNESDFSLAQSLAEQAAVAVYNADLMSVQIAKNKIDMDLTLASNIQQMLLPHSFPRIEGLEIDAFYRPAQMVGGDLYDVFQVGPNRVAVAIADVSGKGIPASLLMAICQTNLRHFSRQVESPAAVLRAMNHELMSEMRPDMFITLIYAIIDTAENTLTFARAGHELPILYHGNGDKEKKVELIGSEGMALGMVPSDIFDVVVADKTVPFEPGDILVLYTDGVTEASDEKDMEFSSKRLGKVIERLHSSNANELNSGIMEQVDKFTAGQSAVDDITLISVKRY